MANTTSEMFQITKSDRIAAVPIGVVFEDLSGIRVEKYTGTKHARVGLEAGVRQLARMAVYVEGLPGYDSRFHRVSAVVWKEEDGTTYETPVFLRWSLGKTTYVYLNASSGSPLVTIKFDRERFLNSRRRVKVRQIGTNYLGPVSLIRITYEDGRVARGVSDPGGMATFGSDDDSRTRRHHYARAALAGFPRN